MDGFFSIVALKGDTISFSYLGFKNLLILSSRIHYPYIFIQYIRLCHKMIFYYLRQLFILTRKEYFKQELLALDISNELRKQAEENLAEKVIREMIKEVPYDG
ncbi:MAG: hypothetical protein R2771_02605 [Saprospiraceae bacterium]